MILCCEVNTHFCRETGYVANTRFLAFFLLRFDSDKCDLTQTLLRHLVKKMVSGASDMHQKRNFVFPNNCVSVLRSKKFAKVHPKFIRHTESTPPVEIK